MPRFTVESWDSEKLVLSQVVQAATIDQAAEIVAGQPVKPTGWIKGKCLVVLPEGAADKQIFVAAEGHEHEGWVNG